MTSDLDNGGDSPTERRRRRVFRVRIWLGAGCYVLASLALGLWGHGPNPWRIILAVLPLLPLAWMVIAIVLRMRQLDEYQIKLFFPGVAVGFIASMVTALTIGTLSSAGLAVPSSGWIVALVGILSWVVTGLFTKAPTA